MPNFFIPVNSINLPVFYGSGCIMPKKYLNSEIYDIQDFAPSYLLLSNHINISGSDCTIEVVLSDEETKRLISIDRENNFFLHRHPFPISRVVRIFFKNEDNKERITAIININTAFLDNSLTRVMQSDVREINFSNNTIVKDNPDYRKALDFYNRALGGFALLKTVNDSQINYFSTLSFFNSLIKSDFERSFGIRENTSKLLDAFFGKEGFRDLFPFLYKEIAESDIYALAKKEGQSINKDKLTGIIELEPLEKMTYVLAVLYNYGVGEEPRKNKIDSLIVNGFESSIKSRYSDIVALCYGINRGYKIFSKEYRVRDINKVVKYKLNSKLDYYTIESIFQFAFFGNLKNGEFKYLDKQFEFTSNYSSAKTILGKEIILKTKPRFNSKEYLSKLFTGNNIESLVRPLIENIANLILRDVEKEFEDVSRDNMANISNLHKENEYLKERINFLSRELSQNNNNEIIYKRKNIESGHENLASDSSQELISLQKQNSDLMYLIDKIEQKAKTNKGISKIIEDFKNDNRLL